MKSAHSPLFPTPRASRSGHADFPAALLSRLGFALTLTLTLLGTFGLHAAAAPEDRVLRSPSGKLIAHITTADNGSLSWSLESGGHVVISPSPLGPVVNTVHLGRNARAGEPTVSETDETYPWRGGKRTATHRSRTYRLTVQSSDVPSPWTLEARVFDDGFAFRYRVPGSGPRQVQGDDAAWTLPAETEAWFQTNTGDYEGAYQHAQLEAIPTTTKSERGEHPVTLGPPVTAILPGVGYVLITEGNLREYSGMTLRPTGTSRLVATFEDDPSGFTLENEIVSPWRVSVVAPDLNALVNSDVLPNLCEPPDPKLFPEGPRTAWIQPGRALVTWCVFGNDGAQWPLQKWFVDQAAALRHELLLVDAGWRTERWGWLKNGGDVWARLKELCDYAATRGVGIVVWHAYPEGRDDGPGLTRPEARRELFARCAAAGVKGVKIDFFNSERLEVVRVYEELARLAAEHHLTINFHGAHKPTGEVRTWPNEITREGIREQEYVLWDSLPLAHYAALPFTRLAVGHADFLPAYVQTKYLRNTTATFQAATAIIATSSFTSWPDHPEDYLVSPFLGLLQAIPNAWDETRVLPGSAIGNLVAFARHSGPDWFVAVLNGTDQRRTWSTDTSFLPNGEFVATLYRDASPHRTLPAIQTGRVLRGSSGPGAPQASADSLQADLEPGGGFVAWIRPRPQP